MFYYKKILKFLFYYRNVGKIQRFSKLLITDYVSDDLVWNVFNTYLIYAPATKDNDIALNILKSFLYRAMSFHIGEN